MRWGKEFPAKHDLTSLRCWVSVGEPINPEAWVWYREVIGLDRCPVVDTWWMTETGQILITPLPGITALKPGSATFPFPSIKADVLDEQGNSRAPGQGRLPGPPAALASHGAHDLGRRRALPDPVLEPISRQLLRG